MVLVMALQDATRDPSWSFPESLKRSLLIRRLSAFVSYLETVCRPTQVNYTPCMQAARTISRILDEVLDSLTSAHAVPDIQLEASEVPESAEVPHATTGVAPTSAEAAEPGLMDFGDLGDLDLVDWADTVDWAATSNEWNFY